MKPEEIAQILKSNISFEQYIQDQVDMDENPKELDQINEGFDCVLTFREMQKRRDELKGCSKDKEVIEVDTSSITNVK